MDDVNKGSSQPETPVWKSGYDHSDSLDELGGKLSPSQKIEHIHALLKAKCSFIDRVAVVLYDPASDILKTYLQSPVNDLPVQFYQTRLAECHSLQEMMAQKKPRVVQDMEMLNKDAKTHTRKILNKGFRSSYTKPLYSEDQFFGFIFVNSFQPNLFSKVLLDLIDPLLQLLSLSINHSLRSVKTLHAALRTTQMIAHHRDPETGSHLERMARYSRLIARIVAPQFDRDDEYVESVFLFAPIHDIGKIVVSDTILFKPGRLTSEEYALMKEHTVKGTEMAEMIVENFNIEGLPHIEIMMNVVRYHHEAIDGSGYPDGLKGEAIPLEARIVAVADVFDALTSQRPYKLAWSTAVAVNELKRLSGKTLDPRCVSALIDNLDEVAQIQQMFEEECLI
ncbi:MAG: HD domain-containing protein [Gammaproteobacteria bacterium]|nr:HD domain-containing protein [Gammaproteobacteria bacterium]